MDKYFVIGHPVKHSLSPEIHKMFAAQFDIETAAVRGNVDATFACLAAMDGAETVSAYARFNCTARYNAASDEYIVVVLYG